MLKKNSGNKRKKVISGDKPVIVGLGDPVVDVYISPNYIPKAGEKVNANYLGNLAGGTVSNTVSAMSVMGGISYLIGEVGDDDKGKLAVEDLKDLGVRVDRIKLNPERTTAWTIVVISDQGERTIFIIKEENGTQDSEKYFGIDKPTNKKLLDEDDLEVIKKADYLYFGYVDQEVLNWVVPFARENGTLVTIDLEPPTLELLDKPWDYLKIADILFLDNDAYSWLSSYTNLYGEELLERIGEAGPCYVVLTRGAKGSLLYTDGEKFQSTGFKVTPRDTTGAGDCYHAAFLYALYQGFSEEEILHFANAAGALAVTKIGPRGGFPTANEVRGFLSNY
jgi:sugar/nucleoside kinase (ribokinase family)